jgi:hypothetical protein
MLHTMQPQTVYLAALEPRQTIFMRSHYTVKGVVQNWSSVPEYFILLFRLEVKCTGRGVRDI